MNSWKFLSVLLLTACTSQRITETEFIDISTNAGSQGNKIILELVKGPAHNHPSMAVWLEDLEGNYIETLFVTQFVAKGVYPHGAISPARWSRDPGPARRPASLPYWAHKRGVRASDGLYIPSPDSPLPDAITAPTPAGSFRLNTASSTRRTGKIRILLEINQPWDSNNFWTNNKFPGDTDYSTSLQPSLVYAAMIDLSELDDPVYLNPIGHGHPSGENGKLFTDLTTLTTAKEIIYSAKIRFK